MIRSQLEYVRHYIQSADTKAAIGLATMTAVSVWFLNTYFTSAIDLATICKGTAVMIALTQLGLSCSCFLFFWAILPRITSSNEKTLFFFQDVARYKLDEFRSAFLTAGEEKHRADRLESLYFSSVICTMKLKLIRLGMISGAISILFSGVIHLIS